MTDFSECDKGLHPFKKIFIGDYNGLSTPVVRWCPVCGCVVVDSDYDGRIAAGDIKKIEYPEITKEHYINKNKK